MIARPAFERPAVGTEDTNWSATSKARRRGIPRRALAGGEDDGGCGLPSTRLGICRCANCRRPRKAARGDTVYLAGLGAPGTHNSGVALVEVTLAHGPRLIVNNEEERFSGNKHTTEYPRASIDAMVAALRGIGRDIGDIDAWLTSWDYPTLAGTLARSVLEEMPQSLKLLRTTEAAGFEEPPPRADDADAKDFSRASLACPNACR